MPPERDPYIGLVVQLGAVLAGAALLAFCWRADLRWFDHHLLQSYFTPRSAYLHMALVDRYGAGFLGLMLLVFVRPMLADWAAQRSPAMLARALLRAGFLIAGSVLLAEGGIRLVEATFVRWGGEHCKLEVCMGQRDLRLGWTFVPSRTTVVACGGRDIEYAFDVHGDRVRARDQTPDPALPAILFAGESIVAGQGLFYDETFPALVAAHMGLQAVNIAVHGYGVDQAYLRLVDALERYRRPVAVVTVFLPEQLDRPLRDVRPHLVLGSAGDLQLAPAPTGLWVGLRVTERVRDWVRYYNEPEMTQMLDVAGAILRDTARRALERGARPLFIVPSFGPSRALEEHPEAWMLRRVFADQGLEYLLIDLDPGWTLPGDGHPNAQAARHIAVAIEQRLRPTSPGALRSTGTR